MGHTLKRTLIAAALAALIPLQVAAYTYASPKSDPLVKGRDPFLAAVAAGDWDGAEDVFDSFVAKIEGMEKADGDYPGDPGIKQDFVLAMQTQDPEASQDVLNRAFVNQINRRLLAAKANIDTYGTASALVVIAQTFYDGLQGDLEPEDQKAVSEQMHAALDAVGKPGVLGVGSKDPDPAAFDKAMESILETLAPYAEGEEEDEDSDY
ncbi:MAG: hypothetical protein OIF40_08230 [Mangrovicoccus sp.]|nr:hypothetical protein [Mangrovicoccus sp.]